jgi:hypothetical protein
MNFISNYFLATEAHSGKTDKKLTMFCPSKNLFLSVPIRVQVVKAPIKAPHKKGFS